MYNLREDWKEHTLPFLRISDKARPENNLPESVDPIVVQHIRELIEEGASVRETARKADVPRTVVQKVRRGRL